MYLELHGLEYLQIYLRIERLIATKVFVLAVAITNCQWDAFAINGISNCLIPRAYRDSIPHNLRRKYCVYRSRDLLWDVCRPCRCIVCILISEGQFARRTGWIWWVSYKCLKECIRAKSHYRSNHRSFLWHRWYTFTNSEKILRYVHDCPSPDYHVQLC